MLVVSQQIMEEVCHKHSANDTMWVLVAEYLLSMYIVPATIGMHEPMSAQISWLNGCKNG